MFVVLYDQAARLAGDSSGPAILLAFYRPKMRTIIKFKLINDCPQTKDQIKNIQNKRVTLNVHSHSTGRTYGIK